MAVYPARLSVACSHGGVAAKAKRQVASKKQEVRASAGYGNAESGEDGAEEESTRGEEGRSTRESASQAKTAEKECEHRDNSILDRGGEDDRRSAAGSAQADYGKRRKGQSEW
jgi:hypothetical protein